MTERHETAPAQAPTRDPDVAPAGPAAPDAPRADESRDAGRDGASRDAGRGPGPGDDTDDVGRPVEIGGQKGPEPTRYGDWEGRGRCTDF